MFLALLVFFFSILVIFSRIVLYAGVFDFGESPLLFLTRRCKFLNLE